MDHASGAPDLVKASKKPNVKLIANYEIAHLMTKTKGLTEN